MFSKDCINHARHPTLLLLSQVYVPDPTAVGQHFADVAEYLAACGWRVIVITSQRAYDDPQIAFPKRELRNGVIVQRLPLSSFGKQSLSRRLAAQLLFAIQAFFRGLLGPRPDVILVSTSPPFAGFIGASLSLLRGVPFAWWVMDVNPDQLVAAGKASTKSVAVRVFDLLNRATLRQASKVITLDRHMRALLANKAEFATEIEIIPPWPLVEGGKKQNGMSTAGDAGAAFRRDHGLGGKFIFMYSGNHALQHPLDTLLDAAEAFRANTEVVFVFIGGGSGKKSVEDRIAKGATNVISLPYQPLSVLEDTLSAADIHVVSMGDNVVGIVHPCKIYGAMAVGRPILFFGPLESHAGEIIEENKIGWRVDHGDIANAIVAVRECAAMDETGRREMGDRAKHTISKHFSRNVLIDRLHKSISSIYRPTPPHQRLPSGIAPPQTSN